MKKRTFTESAAFRQGMKDGVPIGLGYLAVSFSLGIAAKSAGLTPLQGFIASFVMNASAGEYAAFRSIAADATYIELALIILVANARYLLMSSAMAQRLRPGMRDIHRFVMAYDVTDELFAIAIARQGYLVPHYTYGAMVVALPSWAAGTALGIIAGNILPASLVSAFSVALFGMFMAVIIPPARKNRVIAGIIAICFFLSWLCSVHPVTSSISEGLRTIILTVVIAAAAAILFPHVEPEQAEEDENEA